MQNNNITDPDVKNIITLAGNSRPNEDSADIKEKVVQAISNLLKMTSTNSDCNTEDFIKYFFNVQFLACKTCRTVILYRGSNMSLFQVNRGLYNCILEQKQKLKYHCVPISVLVKAKIIFC